MELGKGLTINYVVWSDSLGPLYPQCLGSNSMIKFEHYNGLLLKFQWEIEKLIHEGELPHLKVKIVCACAIYKFN